MLAYVSQPGGTKEAPRNVVSCSMTREGAGGRVKRTHTGLSNTAGQERRCVSRHVAVSSDAMRRSARRIVAGVHNATASQCSAESSKI
eukprot:4013290-Pleurochrysis_carterae.AAC.1